MTYLINELHKLASKSDQINKYATIILYQNKIISKGYNYLINRLTNKP
jgi:deoxycytidylate deaminase